MLQRPVLTGWIFGAGLWSGLLGSGWVSRFARRCLHSRHGRQVLLKPPLRGSIFAGHCHWSAGCGTAAFWALNGISPRTECLFIRCGFSVVPFCRELLPTCWRLSWLRSGFLLESQEFFRGVVSGLVLCYSDKSLLPRRGWFFFLLKMASTVIHSFPLITFFPPVPCSRNPSFPEVLKIFTCFSSNYLQTSSFAFRS